MRGVEDRVLDADAEVGGKMASRTYDVRGTRTELLFWKNLKESAWWSKSKSPTRARTVALWSVMQT